MKIKPKPWKRGDLVFVNRFIDARQIVHFRPGLKRVQIDGLTAETPFVRILFYGVGYEQGMRWSYVKKRWHYWPMLACEFVRLLYYNKIKPKFR